MPGGGEEEDGPVAEEVVVAFQLDPLDRMVEVGSHVYLALVDRRPVGELELTPLRVEGRVREELDAPGVVVVQVGEHDVGDVARLEARYLQLADDVVALFHRHLEGIGRVAQPRSWIVDQRRMAAGVEEDVALGMSDDVEEVGDLDLRADFGVEGVEDRHVGDLAAAVERVDPDRRHQATSSASCLDPPVTPASGPQPAIVSVKPASSSATTARGVGPAGLYQ